MKSELESELKAGVTFGAVDERPVTAPEPDRESVSDFDPSEIEKFLPAIDKEARARKRKTHSDVMFKRELAREQKTWSPEAIQYNVNALQDIANQNGKNVASGKKVVRGGAVRFGSIISDDSISGESDENENEDEARDETRRKSAMKNSAVRGSNIDIRMSCILNREVRKSVLVHQLAAHWHRIEKQIGRQTDRQTQTFTSL